MKFLIFFLALASLAFSADSTATPAEIDTSSSSTKISVSSGSNAEFVLANGTSFTGVYLKTENDTIFIDRGKFKQAIPAQEVLAVRSPFFSKATPGPNTGQNTIHLQKGAGWVLVGLAVYAAIEVIQDATDKETLFKGTEFETTVKNTWTRWHTVSITLSFSTFITGLAFINM